MSAFEELGVMPELIKAVEELEWLCAPHRTLSTADGGLPVPFGSYLS